MINTKKQIVYTAFIIIGAVMLIFDLTGANENVYLKIGGLVLLMLGLYNSTKQWAKDNPKDDKDSTEDEQ
jgi:membrane-bound ClpP family serine protease